MPAFGDRVLDIGASSCPNAIRWDLRRGLPWLDDGSVVVFESCVLEYMPNGTQQAAARELWRVSGGELYATRVEAWCPVTHILTGSQAVVPQGWT